jgi:predicted RNase H-like HicB family nuclease
MYDYQVVIQYSKDDNAFIASIPDLQGCKADGDTPEEALSELSVVYELWIETANDVGKEIPKPLLYAS